MRQIYKNRHKIKEDRVIQKKLLSGLTELTAKLESMLKHEGGEPPIEIPVLREKALSDVEKIVVVLQAGIRDEKKDN